MFDDVALYQDALAKHRNGDVQGAEQGYKAVLAISPDHAGAWHFLGVILHSRRRFDDALLHLEHAISYRDDNAVYYNNYGAVLKDVGRLQDAKIAFQKSLELDPRYADALSNLGLIHLLLNDLDDAENLLHKSLQLQPGHRDACKHLQELRLRQGSKYFEQELFDRAASSFQEAAALPGGRPLWTWKRLGFCPTVFHDEESIAEYWNLLNNQLDSALSQIFVTDWRSLPIDGFTPSFNLPHLDRCCRDVKEKFSRLFERTFPQAPTPSESSKRKHSKIRVGFVVTAGHHRGFFRVYRNIVEQLNPRKFEVFLLCPRPIIGSCQKSVRRTDIAWIGLPERFEQAVDAARETRCDIVFHWKVGGGLLDYFLAQARLAPIQCTSYGSHGSSGVGAIDDYLSSSLLESPSSQNQYTERLVLLDAYATSHERSRVPEAFRDDFNLPASGAIYFCPHRLAKYHPRFDFFLRDILERDSTGQLVLLTGSKQPLANLFAQRLKNNLGETLFKRVRFFPSLPHSQYKSLLSLATCVLDSPVYSGDLTTHDAFESGIPVVTLQGELLVQRYTAGLYRQMGLESLVASDAEEYVNIAVCLGKDAEYRLNVSRQILERNGPIFETRRCVEEYERYFESVV